MISVNQRIQPLEIQEYIKRSQSNCISFAAGLPDLSVLPIQQLKEAYARLLEENNSSFQYQAPITALKEKIQKIMACRSVQCEVDEILITSGAQQAVYLVANLYLHHKASLMVEECVYPGFLQITNMFDLNYLTIPYLFNQGLDLNYLETILKTNKALPFLYVVCNGHNPFGVTMSVQMRKELACLAEKYNFQIIEDDPYHHLNFTDENFLPMRAYTKNAIYIGSFSKMIAPGIRVGWIVADKNTIQKLEQLKDMNDLSSSNPNHLALNQLLERSSLEKIIRPQQFLYKNKLNCMMSALSQCLHVPFRYAIPKHGMFIWLEFLTDACELKHEFIFNESKVMYIPASAFSPKHLKIKNAIRLNFTYPSFNDIELGIEKLSAAIVRSNTNKSIHIPLEFTIASLQR